MIGYLVTNQSRTDERRRDVMSKKQPIIVTRREILEMMGVGSAALVMGRLPAMGAAELIQPPVDASGKIIPGFEKTQVNPMQLRNGSRFPTGRFASVSPDTACAISERHSVFRTIRMLK